MLKECVNFLTCTYVMEPVADPGFPKRSTNP